MSADRSGPHREAFADYHARCRRHLLLVRAHGRGPGWRNRLAWYEARLEATTLSDADLARAIEMLRPVRPSIGAADVRAVRMHALVQELRRRQRLSGHERVVEAIVRRRLATEAKREEEIESGTDREGPKAQ
jgi:hypothetical protein